MTTKKENNGARMKAWREANPEKVKAYRDKYRQKLRDERAARLFFQMHSAVGAMQKLEEKMKERSISPT